MLPAPEYASVQTWSFFWSVFSCIQTEYGGKYPYSVQIRENTNRKNSVLGHFSLSVAIKILGRSVDNNVRFDRYL